MSNISNGTKVIVVSEDGQKFSGTVLASGSQAQVLMYAVELDYPENYPGIELGIKIVEVPAKQVRIDTIALFGKDYYVDVTTPPARFVL